MYAIVETGGKQYRVEPGKVIAVERIQGGVGDSVELDKVLLFSDGEQTRIGNPHISGIKVLSEIVSQGRGDKVIVFKFRRRKKYRRKQGHRQALTRLLIKEIAA
ncbi:MAG: 50S ribosomal protein L21 [candidate division NC10 bacterium]|nr:50S ribosomal protein L21 [candidate division NC10 bacterium]